MSGFSLATAKDDGINFLIGEHQMYATFADDLISVSGFQANVLMPYLLLGNIIYS